MSPYQPRYRLIRNPRDAEINVAEYLKGLGARGVAVTRMSRDGGVDVVAEGLKIQVKAQTSPVGVRPVRELRGVLSVGDAGGFFSLSGFTNGAEDFADGHGLALWEFDYQGLPSPVNRHAQDWVRRHELAARRAEERERQRSALAEERRWAEEDAERERRRQAAAEAERERRPQAAPRGAFLLVEQDRRREAAAQNQQRRRRAALKPEDPQRGVEARRPMRVRCRQCGAVERRAPGSAFVCGCGVRLQAPHRVTQRCSCGLLGVAVPGQRYECECGRRKRAERAPGA